MDRKTKINVLLPIRLVGELDSLSRLGKRSNFIKEAIEDKLYDKHEGIRLKDCSKFRIISELLRKDDVSDLAKKILKLEVEE